jgi:DNA-binding transcriptional MerR regulator
MEPGLTIKEVARLSGLKEHTLRYYERIGLLDVVERAENGHRRYAAQDLAWIEFVNRLRVAGMPVRQMQAFADLRRQGEQTARQRRRLLEEHQATLEGQMAELERNLAVIRDKIGYYRKLEENTHAQP